MTQMRRVITRLLLGATCVAGVATVSSGRQLGVQYKLVPQSAPAPPGLMPALETLRRVIARRDGSALLARVSDNIAFAWAPDKRGKAAFAAEWQVNRRSSEFWTEAPRVLAGGYTVEGDCSTSQCAVWFPYAFRAFPDDELDRLDYFVINGADVPVFPDQTGASRPLVRLSYDLVARLADQTVLVKEGWAGVTLSDGRTGFVRTSSVYDPALGFRMMMMPDAKGRWVIGDFISGD